jgi:hypothetical protein
MTPEEKFIFDLEGYIVIENVLTPHEVTELNDLIDHKFKAYPHDEEGREKSLLSWGDPLVNLMDHPRILPYLIELLGPTVRLDHDYGMFMRPGDKLDDLHGGRGGTHYYHFRNGAMENGLTVVTFCLTDNPAGVGGFACVPGSHKSSFSTREIPEDVRSYQRPAHYVRQPILQAGDALIFTEATIHGTLPWTAQHELRALLFKYSPGHSSWALDYYDNTPDGLTEQQQRLMAPPSATRHPDVVDEN